jgi:hypothetical protein
MRGWLHHPQPAFLLHASVPAIGYGALLPRRGDKHLNSISHKLAIVSFDSSVACNV